MTSTPDWMPPKRSRKTNSTPAAESAASAATTATTSAQAQTSTATVAATHTSTKAAVTSTAPTAATPTATIQSPQASTASATHSSTSSTLNQLPAMSRSLLGANQDFATDLSNRVQAVLPQLTEGLIERDEIMAIAFLAALAGHNTFLFGPPGTAKSLISRRLASAFTDTNYFDHLMNKFTTPEEIFGPVSIKEMKQDNYVRKTDGYLPWANFAFLDEIWKSSSAVLNSLLTIINEGLYKNGDQVIKTNLRSLIAASNEVPDPASGLAAMYDRFSVRLLVDLIQNDDNFESFLQGSAVSEKANIAPENLFTQADLVAIRQKVADVKLSPETLKVIRKVKSALDEEGIYISDRRWFKTAQLIKASALASGSYTTNLADACIIAHCVWDDPNKIQETKDIVYNAIAEHCDFALGESTIKQIDLLLNKVMKEMHWLVSSFLSREPVYTHNLKTKQFKDVNGDSITLLDIPNTRYALTPFNEGTDEIQCYQTYYGKATLLEFSTVQLDSRSGMLYLRDRSGTKERLVQLVFKYPGGHVNLTKLNQELDAVDQCLGRISDFKEQLEQIRAELVDHEQLQSNFATGLEDLLKPTITEACRVSNNRAVDSLSSLDNLVSAKNVSGETEEFLTDIYHLCYDTFTTVLDWSGADDGDDDGDDDTDDSEDE